MQHLDKELSILQDEHQFRSLKDSNRFDDAKIIRDQQNMTSFISNDYLGIASNESFKKEFLNEIDNQTSINFGSASSRLLEGNHQIFNTLEEKVASSYQKGGCLYMNSGWHANTGILSCLPQKGDLILSDKLNHASIVDGIRLSSAHFERFRHKDYQHLTDILNKKRKDFRQVYIISESLFSMDGDFAELSKLADIKNQFDSYLIIDEAHSVGAYGNNGLGCVASSGLLNEVDILVLPCGKALGGVGAFVVSSQVVKHYLINKCRSFIFTTALPTINAAWMNFVWDKLPDMYSSRDKLQENINYYNQLMQGFGHQVVSDSYIQPIHVGSNESTIQLSNHLEDHQLVCSPIRYPTVPKNKSRLRISLTSMHSKSQILQLCKEVTHQLKHTNHEISMA
ncbi:aminotransferase class I/II-fold pyridoxal phosphate-dependent enzyme [Flammeovirga pacifica]|uniref:Aminotransferase class I/classII large domain-containing protein n=1 Tax=Flammeovirga pacifica TaxID=915059 RepID=A0A1S1YVW6_FLAPC|nr:8-amino-7-oxononanoate synthase [Flammeovirga pacifica]OHX64993.1 hypothetical protein NH26_00825 [Flammeovirga pacifica]